MIQVYEAAIVSRDTVGGQDVHDGYRELTWAPAST